MGHSFEEDQSSSTENVGIKILIQKIRQYKIKKRYGLKGIPDGWFIYGRYIVPAKSGSSYKRRRLSGPFASRKEAVRVAGKLMRKSNKFVKRVMKKHEVSERCRSGQRGQKAT